MNLRPEREMGVKSAEELKAAIHEGWTPLERDLNLPPGELLEAIDLAEASRYAKSLLVGRERNRELTLIEKEILRVINVALNASNVGRD
jgi:hypothetical protein